MLLALGPVAARAHAIVVSFAAGRQRRGARKNRRRDGCASTAASIPCGRGCCWCAPTVPRPRSRLNDTPSPDTLAATVGELAPRAYRLRWQVLAIDGHITRGDIPFTVAP